MKSVSWSFDGIFGKFDRQAIQRGFQVYKEVCSACHGVNKVSFGNLIQVGFSEGEAKTIAAGYQFTDGPNDSGDMYQRNGLLSDKIPSPYPNSNAAAAANNGAVPPDLSLIVKARFNGANYVYSILTGYDHPKPDNITLAASMSYNPYFPGEKIAMPKPLSDGQITFQDGTTATVDQMAKDVVNFLQWTAEPEMEARKGMGIKVLIFLTITTTVLYFSMKRIWSRVE